MPPCVLKNEAFRDAKRTRNEYDIHPTERSAQPKVITKLNITKMTSHLLFIGNLGTGEMVFIALIVLLLFGGKKIPELMRGLGKGVNSFKQGMNEIEKDITAEPKKPEENYQKEEK